jgi:hypothetical protein
MEKEMTTSEIMRMQKKIGTTPDGFFGPKSMEACKRHLRKLMPSPHPWPKPDQKSMEAFYGPAGHVSTVKVEVPYKMYLYDGPKTVQTITVHTKVAKSFERILNDLKRVYPTDAERSEAGVNKFFGSYVVRPMRTGKAWSKHAWAVAVDFDANRNGLFTNWPTRSKMPLEVMECFAKEGWLNLGWLIGRDAMHFQATQ